MSRASSTSSRSGSSCGSRHQRADRLSGIAGLVEIDGSPADPSVLERLSACIRARGPDAEDTWIQGPAGLAHSLLRTTDEAASERQPVTLEGRYWITADARIDARAELIQRLASAGERPHDAATEPELLLHAYRAWGDGMVVRIIGDFAFAVWDSEERKLFCARDHMGVKPFYYARIGRTFVFSNTLACARSIVPPRVNPAAVGDFLLAGWNQDAGTTSFADVMQLPPAHTLTLAGGTVRTARYWQVPVPSERRYDDQREYVERFSSLLRVATADRIRGDSASVLMSGGLDSPSVAAFARGTLGARGRGDSLRAVTVVHSYGDGNERHYAELVAARLGIDVDYLAGDDWGHFRDWQAAARGNTEPRDNPMLGFAARQRQVAAAHSRVLLTGFDADALLAQSRKAYIAHLIATRSWAGFARTTAAFVRSQRRIPTLGIANRLTKRRSRAAPPEYYPSWLNPDFEGQLGLRERYREISEPRVPPEYAVREHAYMYLTAANWNRLFTDEDPGVSGLHLEVRHPLADVRLIELSMSLPQVPWCIGKHILRTAMRGTLPDEVLDRKKSGFSGFVRHSSPEHDVLAAAARANEALGEFVRLDRLPLRRADGRLETHWLHLRPLQLGHWLEDPGIWSAPRSPARQD